SARRSGGVGVSSTTSNASPTESASTAWCYGLLASARSTMGSGTYGLRDTSRRALRERSIFSDTRATMVVSQLARFSTSSAPARLTRSQASWTASSASLSDPSMRYATPHSRGRSSSKRSASHAWSFMSSRPPSQRVRQHDPRRGPYVTEGGFDSARGDGELLGEAPGRTEAVVDLEHSVSFQEHRRGHGHDA